MRRLALLLVPALAAPVAARAQGSVFSLRGLGWVARGESARSAATGGALDLLDPEMSANPAALARFRSVAGWAVAAPTSRTFSGPAGSADLETFRFPLFGFAAVLPGRAVVGVSISDYLDRSLTITRVDTAMLRGVGQQYIDGYSSVGGASDMALTGAYRITDDLMIGVAAHYYLGSSRLATQRVFCDTLGTTGQTASSECRVASPLYSQIAEQSITDYRGFGAAAGVIATIGRVDLSASGRLNGRLRSLNTGGIEAFTQLPAQFAAGARLQLVPGVYVSGVAQFAGWHAANADLIAAGKDGARDAWSLGVGAEALSVSVFGLHTPLRLGYRWRQLPFLSLGQGINEWGVSGGFGLSLARDRTTVDLGFERGRRSTGAEQESFTTMFVGLTVRP